MKFPIGSFVKIGKLPPHMSLFPQNTVARVMYSSTSEERTYIEQEIIDRMDANDVMDEEPDEYGLLVKIKRGWHEHCWFEADQLKLIKDKKLIKELKIDIEKGYEDLKETIKKRKALKKMGLWRKEVKDEKEK